MYKRYRLSLDSDVSSHLQTGSKIFDRHRASVKQSLDSFLKGGPLDGSQLQAHWFPQIHADIFLSHSHKDIELAIGFAGWLKEAFGLVLFIDSCIWGYSDDLLKQIDNKFCINQGGVTYSYQKRNGSTSHVHMMLNAALSKMIDRTECLFFLNTPNSISSREAVAKTQSPWLYSEIAISEVIRQRPPPGKMTKVAKLLESLRIEYALDLSSMKEIAAETLNDWYAQFKRNQTTHPLDYLYQITGDELPDRD